MGRLVTFRQLRPQDGPSRSPHFQTTVNDLLNVLFLLCRSCRGFAQFGDTVTKLFPHLRWREPACAPAGDQEISRQFRAFQLVRLRSKSRNGYQSLSHYNDPAQKPKDAAQKSVRPSQSHSMRCPTDDAGYSTRQQNDHKKNCQKTRKVRDGGLLHIRQEPRGELSVTPG